MKWRTFSIFGWTEAVWFTQTSRLGGSIDTTETAVAVIPIGSPSTQIEMTFTVEATRRIACLKLSGKLRDRSSVIDPGMDAARPARQSRRNWKCK